ncbi:MAG: FliM/FliN family flagellar motor switch protein [bacterium]
MEKEIYDYDFRNPQRLTKDNIISLKTIYSEFSKKIGAWLSNRLQEEITIETEDSLQTDYSKFISKYPYPTILGLISQNPLTLNSIIGIKPSFAFYLIEKFLGGKGEGVEINREITSVEKEVLKKVLDEFINVLKQAWIGVCEIDFKLEDIATNPLSLKAISLNEIVIKTGFKIRIKEREENFSLCLPFISIEPYLDRLTTKPKKEKKEAETASATIEFIPIPVVALLGKTKLTMADVLNLSCGDVLKLPARVSDGVVLCAGGKERFIATPGVSGGNMAVQIRKVMKEEGNEST